MEGMNFKDSSATVSTTWAEVLPRSKNRDCVVLYNGGLNDVYFGFAEDNLIRIPAGQGITLNPAPINAIWAKTLTSTSSLVIWEAE